MKKGMIFIDGSNLYFDWLYAKMVQPLEIAKYIDVVKDKFPNIDFLRTYYFTSQTATNGAYLHYINTLPYCEVITGRLQEKPIKLDKYKVICPSCGKDITQEIITTVDKGTDVNIAVEMLRHGFNHTYDTAVLVSRDADFSSVVKILKSIGCTVELVLFDTSKSSAYELTSCVDHVVLLDSSDRNNCVSTAATMAAAPAMAVSTATATKGTP